MMLFIGICINLTKNPMNPIIANPIAVAIAIFWNSIKRTEINTGLTLEIQKYSSILFRSQDVFVEYIRIRGLWPWNELRKFSNKIKIILRLTFPIWFRASFYQSQGILSELFSGVNELHYLIHSLLFYLQTN